MEERTIQQVMLDIKAEDFFNSMTTGNYKLITKDEFEYNEILDEYKVITNVKRSPLEKKINKLEDKLNNLILLRNIKNDGILEKFGVTSVNKIEKINSLKDKIDLVKSQLPESNKKIVKDDNPYVFDKILAEVRVSSKININRDVNLVEFLFLINALKNNKNE